ncbi:uncharacterized protein RMCC_5791 [Mycolicibacterium canariasense]|uniref:C2H2-type domain-containing protein n=1 Tax=Mycolicibacterium canariasense TaxID=228230 RepID=A0A100WIB5_MYCCR|nr:hypothetical protein [Mycolicibacterium canariasense]MCV7210178.1 hypothetical protein [Mycolicibacterium canariasense]GAS98826.1 uncharacterized protein RMCC_5791 [Mycolicibacterium canariasense]
MTNTTIGCARCTNRWGGLNTAHCGACHQTFTTTSAFDKHRDGNHAQGTRHCVDPSTVGLVNAGRAYPCWGWPNDGRNPHSADISDETTPQALSPQDA